MAVVAKWITKNGHKVYLKKGGSKKVHPDYYRVEGKGIKPDANQRQDAYHFLDKKHALEVAKANVRVKDFRHDTKKHGFDKAREQKDKLRIGQLQRKIVSLRNERARIMKHYTPKKLDRLDRLNHELPYLRTELQNLGGKELEWNGVKHA